MRIKIRDILKKLWPVLLMIWPYILGFWGDLEEVVGTEMAEVYLFFSVVVYVFNIINAFLYKGENAAYELARFNMIMKIVHVPYYLLVFVIGGLFLGASVVPAFVLITPIMLIPLFVTDVLLLVTSSMYGLNAIRRARKSGFISRKVAFKNLVMHFIFVLDVVSAINIFVKIRKRMRAEKLANFPTF